MPDKVVALVSGGVDSTVAVAMLEAAGDTCLPLFVDYGQRARSRELDAIRRLHDRTELRRLPYLVPPAEGVPIYPIRNMALIVTAAIYAMDVGAAAVAIGCNADDASVFPDCSIFFLNAAKKCLRAYDLRLEAPVAQMPRTEVVCTAAALGVDLSFCWSCYGEGPDPCGECLSCRQ